MVFDNGNQPAVGIYLGALVQLVEGQAEHLQVHAYLAHDRYVEEVDASCL